MWSVMCDVVWGKVYGVIVVYTQFGEGCSDVCGIWCGEWLCSVVCAVPYT